MKKRVGSLFIVVVIVFSSLFAFGAPNNAVDTYNQNVYDYAVRIQKTYGVDVNYTFRADGYAAIGTASLATLEKALGFITPSVVSQVSKYYNNTRGKHLLFKFTYLPEVYDGLDISALARFTESTSTIELFIPYAGSKMTLSGTSPIAIAHEFGHAFQVFYDEQHGATKLRDEWVAYNGSLQYSKIYRNNPDKLTFISDYASVNFEEDFAETFAYAFTSNRAGLGIANCMYQSAGTRSNLKKKIDHIQTILPKYLTNTGVALQNIYTSQITPTYKMYNNIKLSGNSLEYIGFFPPHGIYDNIVESLKIHPQGEAPWLTDIGAWKVTDKNGGCYLVFPGSSFVTLQLPAKTE